MPRLIYKYYVVISLMYTFLILHEGINDNDVEIIVEKFRFGLFHVAKFNSDIFRIAFLILSMTMHNQHVTGINQTLTDHSASNQYIGILKLKKIISQSYFFLK